MDRIFHARVHFLMYVLLGLLTAGVCLSFVYRLGLCAVLMLLLLVVVVERIVHTTYTITADGRLVVSCGRFSRPRVVALRDVVRVERCRRMRVGGYSLFAYLLVTYGPEKAVAVMPVREDDFVETLTRRCREMAGRIASTSEPERP